MSRDRFIYWDGRDGVNGVVGKLEDKPDQVYVREELKDYLEGIQLDIDYDGDRITVTFPSSFWQFGELHQRFFEVHYGHDNVDVITRHMDDFTNCVADGFAKRLARKKKGRLDDK